MITALRPERFQSSLWRCLVTDSKLLMSQHETCAVLERKKLLVEQIYIPSVCSVSDFVYARGAASLGLSAQTQVLAFDTRGPRHIKSATEGD